MNTSFSLAFMAGIISFLSPCVLPLIPGYISYISGTSIKELSEKKNNLVLIKTIFFTLGFSLVFITLGSAASLLGKFFLNNSLILRIAAGIIIVKEAGGKINDLSYSSNEDINVYAGSNTIYEKMLENLNNF